MWDTSGGRKGIRPVTNWPPMSLNLFRPPIFLTLVRRSCDWGVADPHCAKFGRSRSKGMSNYIDPPEKKMTPRIAPFKVTNIIKTDTD